VVLYIGEDNSAMGKIYHGLIKFDLSPLPSNANILSATLSLWTASDFSSNDATIPIV